MKPVITEASALSSRLVLSSNGFQRLGWSQVRVPSENSPPPSPSVYPSLPQTSPSTSPPAAIFFLLPDDDVGGVAVACSWISQLQLQDSSLDEPEQTPACYATASNYMVIQIIGDDYRLWSEPVLRLDRSRFEISPKMLALRWPRLCLLSKPIPIRIGRNAFRDPKY